MKLIQFLCVHLASIELAKGDKDRCSHNILDWSKAIKNLYLLIVYKSDPFGHDIQQTSPNRIQQIKL